MENIGRLFTLAVQVRAHKVYKRDCRIDKVSSTDCTDQNVNHRNFHGLQFLGDTLEDSTVDRGIYRSYSYVSSRPGARNKCGKCSIKSASFAGES